MSKHTLVATIVLAATVLTMASPAMAEPSRPPGDLEPRLHLSLLAGYSCLVDILGSNFINRDNSLTPLGPTVLALWDKGGRRHSLVMGGRMSGFVGERGYGIELVMSAGVRLVQRRHLELFLLPGVGLASFGGVSKVPIHSGNRRSPVYSMAISFAIPSHHRLEMMLYGAFEVLPALRYWNRLIGMDIFLGIGIGYRTV